MRIHEYLRNEKEPTPKWLENFEVGKKITGEELFSGRTLYYPGAFDDGQPLKNVNLGHYSHVYFYVDYYMLKDELIGRLKEEGAFIGYKLLDIQDIPESELCPRGWTPHVNVRPEYNEHIRNNKPYCIVAIFERLDEFDEEHGCKRFALVYLYADAIATYDAVFANYNRKPDFLVLQDHGFGGNYDRFGNGGLMHEIARKTNTFPKYIFCAKNTDIWDGYERVTYRREMTEAEKKVFSKTIMIDDNGNEVKGDGTVPISLDPEFHGVKRFLYKKCL